jgi:hypothetical protein
MDKHLNEVIANRNTKMGIGGNYSVNISMNNPNILLLRVGNLTEQAARVLFDQIDESNYMHKRAPEIRIELLKEKKVTDYNILPNAMTERI